MFLKSLTSKFTQWLNDDPVERSWTELSKTQPKLVSITLRFENGLLRELKGEAALRWHRAMFDVGMGRRPNWPKPNEWTNTKLDDVPNEQNQTQV